MAGALLALSFKYYIVSGELLALRVSAIDSEKFIEAQQTQTGALRVQFQGQQERLNKGSAIGETVGPAVVRDIASLSEKTGNTRLSDLLKRHGVQIRGTVGVAEVAPAGSGPAPAKGGHGVQAPKRGESK